MVTLRDNAFMEFKWKGLFMNWSTEFIFSLQIRWGMIFGRVNGLRNFTFGNISNDSNINFRSSLISNLDQKLNSITWFLILKWLRTPDKSSFKKSAGPKVTGPKVNLMYSVFWWKIQTILLENVFVVDWRILWRAWVFHLRKISQNTLFKGFIRICSSTIPLLKFFVLCNVPALTDTQVEMMISGILGTLISFMI